MSASIPPEKEWKAIRVVVADGHEIVSLGIRLLLGSFPDISIVGEADDGCDAVALIERLTPSVAMLDSAMSRLNAIEAARPTSTSSMASGTRRTSSPPSSGVLATTASRPRNDTPRSRSSADSRACFS